MFSLRFIRRLLLFLAGLSLLFGSVAAEGSSGVIDLGNSVKGSLEGVVANSTGFSIEKIELALVGLTFLVFGLKFETFGNYLKYFFFFIAGVIFLNVIGII